MAADHGSLGLLPHVDEVKGKRVRKHRDVYAVTVRGPRGGVRIPVQVIWRKCGSGLGTMVTEDENGRTAIALYPDVQWHNGNEKARYTPLLEWLKDPAYEAAVELAKES